MFNIVKTLNDIANLLAPSANPLQGVNKVDALDNILFEIDGNVNRLNIIDAALGGPGNWTTVNDVLASMDIQITALAPTKNTSGTYNPVATPVSNITSVSPDAAALFLRVGNMITVAGILTSLTPTAAGTWSFRLSLPVSSDIQVFTEVSGVMNLAQNDELPSRIVGDITNNEALFSGRAVTTFTATNGSYIFQYLVR